MTTPSADKLANERIASHEEPLSSTSASQDSRRCLPLAVGDELPSVVCRISLDEMKPVKNDSLAITPTVLPFQFGLATLMLTITLISVFLAVAVQSPVIGIGLLILVTPAYLRTVFITRRLQQSGRRLAVAEQTLLCLKSLSIVLEICLSGVAAFVGCFVIACATIDFGYVAIAESLACGMVVSVLVAVCRWPFDEKTDYELNQDVNSVQRQ